MIQGGLELEKPDQPTIFNDKNEKILKDSFYGSMRLGGKVLALVIKMVPNFIMYAFLSFIYLSIYEVRGFETAIILLLVGVMIFANRGNKGQIKR